MKAFFKKLFLILFRIIVAVVKIFACLAITFFVGYFAAIASATAIAGKQGFDWQVLLYVIATVFTILGIWLIAFIKTKKIQKLFLQLYF